MRINTHMSSSFLTTHVFKSAASSSLTNMAAVRAGLLWSGGGALLDAVSGYFLSKGTDNRLW